MENSHVLSDALQEDSKGIGHGNESDWKTCSSGESDHGSNTTGLSSISQQPNIKPTTPRKPLKQIFSAATNEWHRRKEHGEDCDVIDELMQYQGLEEVKQYFLDMKSKIEVCREQDPEGTMQVLSLERFNVVFQGNPGTGKTTVARLYAKFLHEEGVLKSSYIEETSGVEVALLGGNDMKQTIKAMRYKNGGVIFIDEAYQLMAGYNNRDGKQVLDVILSALENNIGTISAVFTGYKDEMVSFFDHNPGLESRVPHTINFADFDDYELWQIFADKLQKQYNGNMRVEGDIDGLYVRIAIRRLAQARGSRGYGNARAVENLLARIRQRQARRLMREKNEMQKQNSEYLIFTKEDIIGPDPSVMAKSCPAWIKLQELIGLEEVKQSAERFIGMIELNYQRELREEHPMEVSLNQVFVGAPGTGKTTVAKLFGQILADLGYLSRGDVVIKTPADFIGNALGASEDKTRNILLSTVGKVLVIDEAYMLDAGDLNKDQDKFKAGIIDTIVSMTQGVPGEDRCIILVGYEDKIRGLFQNANPGFSRRFPVHHPFQFKDFNIHQLEEILRLKMKEEHVVCTDDAIVAARDLLSQALMRSNFTNAGEVNSVLATAKMNYATRISRLPLQEKLLATALEAIDFDPDFVLRRNFEPGCDKTLDGRVERRIVEQLVGYQRGYCLAKKRNMNPRSFVGTNFIFKGPSGTGKKTTASYMGKMFYDLGLISTKEVYECTATDLIGQYVGQTAPKTRKKLKDALGRILVISDSGRLTHGSYAAEAMEELLQFLANPCFLGKIVIIIAGLTADINKLLSQYPALSGFFTEELLFEAISPDDCIEMLLKELEIPGVEINLEKLTNSGSEEYVRVRQLFGSLGAQRTCWSNARDVKNLAKQIVKRAFVNSPQQSELDQEFSVTYRHVTESMELMHSQRKGRSGTSGADRGSNNYSSAHEVYREAAAPPQHRMDVHLNTRGSKDIRPSLDPSVQPQSLSSFQAFSPQSLATQKADNPTRNGDKRQKGFSNHTNVEREDGVTDEDWEIFCKKKQDQSFQSGVQYMKKQVLERQLASFKEQKDEEKVKLYQNRLSQTQEKILEVEKIQKTLREMGRCVNGFAWVREGDGYRCEGGAHFVSERELYEKML